MQKPADLDHAQLSAFPNRTEPFFGALLAELHELLDVHDVDESTDSSNIAQTISSLNSSLVNIEISCKFDCRASSVHVVSSSE